MPSTNTAQTRSPCSRGSRRCASAPACTSARPASAASTTSSTRCSTTASTRPSRGTATRSRRRSCPTARSASATTARGIPVERNDKYDMSTVQVVLTMLHAGGKFGGGGYKVSGGLHGVGVSVVNALSEWLTVEVRRDGLRLDAELRARRADDGARQGRADDRARHHGHVQARRRHLRDDRGRLRGDRDARARDGVPHARPAADADRSAHRGPRRRVLRRERPGRLRAAHQQEPHAHAQDADRVRARDRGRHRRGRDAVERQLPGLGALVREQHQHARGRHAPHGLPLGADAHGQRLRALDRA